MSHVIGFIGTFLVLGAYFLLSTGRIKAASVQYQGINLVGAGLLTLYGALLAAWASIALNAIWGLIALIALIRVFGPNQDSGPSNAVKACLSKYADFSGRANRSEFWWWYLFVGIATATPLLIGAVIVIASSSDGRSGIALAGAVACFSLGALVSLALIIPTYAVGCRRLHDRGISGWFQLITLVPCGNVVLLVPWALAGQAHPNQYGDPLQ